MEPQIISDINKWTYSACLKDAKKHHSEDEWRDKNPDAHQVAVRSHWIVELRMHFKAKKLPKSSLKTSKKNKKSTSHSPKQCLNLAKRCKTITEWRNMHPKSVKDAKVHGVYDQCIEHMHIRGYNQWTKEQCMERALSFGTRSEWSRGHAATYHYAKKMGWFKDCVEHMPKPYETTRLEITKEQCLEHAKAFSTRTEWNQSHPQSYRVAKQNGWFDDCVEHMVKPKPRKQWTKEKCVSIAQSYSNRKEWREGDLSSYSAAYQYDWMKSCTEHMPARSSSRKPWTKTECKKHAKKFQSRTEWTREIGRAHV